MTKAEALYQFWAQFEVPVYDEQSVPTGIHAPSLPYITYESATDSLGGELSLTASIWTRGDGWESAEGISDRIAKVIAEFGYWIKPIDGGYLRICKRTPFAQRMPDPSDDAIRRIVLNITAEFMTAY